MKRIERDKAINLRKQGMSMREIAKILHVAKASVSVWVRNIPLTIAQRRKLSSNGFSIDIIEKRRTTRINRTKEKHLAIMSRAAKAIPRLSRHDLWFLGIALYWGEGGKTNHGSARLSNSDPAVIRSMMRFFREICNVPEKKFRGHIHTFSHLNKNVAEKYWSAISGISRDQFFKTYIKPSIASKGKRDSLPYGTFQIYVNDKKVFLTILGWIEKIKSLV